MHNFSDIQKRTVFSVRFLIVCFSAKKPPAELVRKKDFRYK